MNHRVPATLDRASLPCWRLLPLALCLGLAGLANAQESSRPRDPGSAAGQDPDGGGPLRSRPVTVLSTASITETVTDNALLRDSEKRSDAVTLATVGVTVLANTARVRGSLDYQLTGSAHARESKANRTGQSLLSALNAEIVDDLFFVDARASISQQLVSAFGQQDIDPGFDNPNRTEVSALTITPALRSRIGSVAQLDARVSYGRQHSQGTTVGDLSSRSETIVLSQQTATRLSWNASVQRQTTEFKDSRRTRSARALVGASYAVNPSLRLSANAGREQNDIRTLSDENTTTYGVGMQWVPSERTQLGLTWDRRFFGDAHSVNFSHRQARTVWRFTSSREVQNAQPGINTTLLSAYDLLFDALASDVPDPAQRRQLVLLFLQQQGIAPGSLVANTFLSGAVNLLTRQDFGMVYQGLRSSAAFSISYSDSRRLDQAAAVVDDLANNKRVRQLTYSLLLGHRLTPISGINLTLTRTRARGDTVDRNSDLSSLALNWTSQLGRRATVSLGARHVEFENRSTPYNENALFATLGVRF
jgi:uncharacterized protein (PEP-CTERM system associated)